MRKTAVACLQPTLSFVFRTLLLISALTQARAQVAAASDSAAVSALTQSLNAMGGSTAWSALSDSTLTGTCQSLSQQTGGSQEATPFRWINAGGQFRYENGGPSEFGVMLSGHGKPQMILPNEIRTLTYETADLQKPFHLPGLVLQSVLSDPNYSIEVIGQESVSGQETIHVRIVRRHLAFLQRGTKQDWWIGSTTFLPAKVTFQVPGQAVESYMAVTYAYSGWAADVNGVLIPHQILLTNELGVLPQTCTVSQLTVNTQPAASLFDAR